MATVKLNDLVVGRTYRHARNRRFVVTVMSRFESSRGGKSDTKTRFNRRAAGLPRQIVRAQQVGGYNMQELILLYGFTGVSVAALYAALGLELEGGRRRYPPALATAALFWPFALWHLVKLVAAAVRDAREQYIENGIRICPECFIAELPDTCDETCAHCGWAPFYLGPRHDGGFDAFTEYVLRRTAEGNGLTYEQLTGRAVRHD